MTDRYIDFLEGLFGFRPLGTESRRRRSYTPPVKRLRGRSDQFLDIHKAECAAAIAARGEKLKILIAQLHNRASDERHLGTTWSALATLEKTHPGTTAFGMVADFDSVRIRYSVKLIQRVMRNRNFCPAPDDQVWWTALSLAGDQLIRFAVFQILEPVLTPGLDQLTIRDVSDDDREHGVDAAVSLSAKKARFIWMTAKVSSPLDHVPRDRLLDLFWEKLKNRKLIFLIEDLFTTPSKNGIREGSQMAELLLDFYLDWAVVRKWRNLHPKVPLIRSDGEFLVLCRTRNGAERLYPEIMSLLKKAGMAVDKPDGPPIRDLASGETAAWLGSVISRRNDEWRIQREK